MSGTRPSSDCRSTHTSNMYDNVDVLHDIVANAGGGEIPSDDHIKQFSIFFSTSLHLVGFGLGPRRCGNLDSAFEEKVNYVGTDETCGTGDENMTEKTALQLSRLDLRHLKGMVLTEGQTL